MSKVHSIEVRQRHLQAQANFFNYVSHSPADDNQRVIFTKYVAVDQSGSILIGITHHSECNKRSVLSLSFILLADTIARAAVAISALDVAVIVQAELDRSRVACTSG